MQAPVAARATAGLGVLILCALVSRCQLIGSAIDPEEGRTGDLCPEGSEGDMGQLCWPEGKAIVLRRSGAPATAAGAQRRACRGHPGNTAGFPPAQDLSPPSATQATPQPDQGRPPGPSAGQDERQPTVAASQHRRCFKRSQTQADQMSWSKRDRKLLTPGM